MTIYLDASVLGRQRPTAAFRALRHLRDAGYRMVIVAGDGDPAPGPLPPDLAATSDVPEEPEPGSWFLTADPERCATRRPGLRSIFVGPPVSGRQAIARCDVGVRDLGAAALEILAFDAGQASTPS